VIQSSEKQSLLEDVQYLFEEIENGIDDLKGFRSRFHHLWPANFELEPSLRRVARLRGQMGDEVEPEQLRQFVKMLEVEKDMIVQKISELWDAERKDRLKYR